MATTEEESSSNNENNTNEEEGYYYHHQPLFEDSPTLLAAIQDDVDNLHNKCNKVRSYSAEDLINYHKVSGLKLLKLSIMVEMLQSYLDKGY